MNMASRKRTSTLCLCAVTAWAFGSPVSAEEFVLVYHEASGSGSARLLDGGDTEFGGGMTFGPTDPSMSFVARDISTQPGVLAARSKASGRSNINFIDGDLSIRVELSVLYLPSNITGGDNPGGMADGELSSVIEFMMPVEEVEWVYFLDVDDTVSFEGSSSVLIENVTQRQELVSLNEGMDGIVETTLSANVGDIIRITSEMEGFGSTGPAGTREYTSIFGMSLFMIPEPSTLMLFAPAALLLHRRTRRPEAAGRCGASVVGSPTFEKVGHQSGEVGHLRRSSETGTSGNARPTELIDIRGGVTHNHDFGTVCDAFDVHG